LTLSRAATAATPANGITSRIHVIWTLAPSGVRQLTSAARARRGRPSRALCLWMESVGSTSPRRDLGPVAPIWVFLARGRFASKALLLSVGFPWISLDSLVRIETFQWVTRLVAGILFLGPFPGVRSAGTGACGRGHGSAGLFTWQALIQFLIFCKRLSSEPFPFGRLIQKQLALGPNWAAFPVFLNESSRFQARDASPAGLRTPATLSRRIQRRFDGPQHPLLRPL
jgi:hypothetical protein